MAAADSTQTGRFTYNELQSRLREAEETLDAIRNGEVDAIVVSGTDGEKIFSLASAETPYRIILEEMNEGALIVSAAGLILYSNRRFAALLETPHRTITGSDILSYIIPDDREAFRNLLQKGLTDRTKGIVTCNSGTGELIHLQLSLVALSTETGGNVCIVASDITEIKNYQDTLQEIVKARTSDLETANLNLTDKIKKLRKSRQNLKDASVRNKTLLASITESEKKFRTIVETAFEGIIISNPTGTFKFVNSRFAEMLGYTPDELLGSVSNKYIYPEDIDKVQDTRSLLKRGKVVQNEMRFLHKDGKVLWTLFNASPMFDSHGRHTGNLAIHTDITERKKSEEKLHKSEEQFRAAFDKGAIPMVLTSMDGNFIQPNPAFCNLLGYSEKDLKKMNFKQITHPDHLGVNIEGLNALRRGDIPSFRLEKKYIRKSGESVWVDMSTAPVRDKAGNLEYLVTHVQDINERKKAESELSRSREKLEVALECGNIGIWERNLLNDTLTCDNRMCQIFGIKSRNKEVSFEDLINEEDIRHFDDVVHKALKDGSSFETVFRTKPENGITKYITTNAVLNKNENGETVSMTGVCFDVTAMKEGAEKAVMKLNEELLRSNMELESFAYVASHDLQEPLRMVSSFTQMLERKYHDQLDQDARDYIKFAVDGAKRMYELINGLLEYSRIQTRGTGFSSVNMNKVYDKVVQNLSLKISEKGAKITKTKLPFINADESQMIQLLQNLVENGIKFSRDIPRIHISGELRDGKHLISVSDNGMGIDRQYFERIFKIFQRLMPKEEFEGTGIGLAICRRIVERHNGKIWVESEPGKGSTFHFIIPSG